MDFLTAVFLPIIAAAWLLLGLLCPGIAPPLFITSFAVAVIVLLASWANGTQQANRE